MSRQAWAYTRTSGPPEEKNLRRRRPRGRQSRTPVVKPTRAVEVRAHPYRDAEAPGAGFEARSEAFDFFPRQVPSASERGARPGRTSSRESGAPLLSASRPSGWKHRLNPLGLSGLESSRARVPRPFDRLCIVLGRSPQELSRPQSHIFYPQHASGRPAGSPQHDVFIGRFPHMGTQRRDDAPRHRVRSSQTISFDRLPIHSV